MSEATEKICGFLQNLKFKKKVFGGVKEEDVLMKFSELDSLYQAVFVEKTEYLKGQIIALREQLDEKDELLTQKANEAEELNARIIALNERIELLTQKAAEAEELNAEVAALNERLELLTQKTAEAEELNAQIVALNETIEQLRANGSSAEVSNSVLEEMKLLQTKYNNALDEMSLLQIKYNSALENATTLRVEKNKLLAEKEALSVKYDSTLENATMLRTEKERLLTEKEELSMKYDSTLENATMLRTEKEQLLAEKEELSMKYDSTLENATMLRTEKEQLLAEKEELSASLREAMERTLSPDQDSTCFYGDITLLQERCDRLSAEKDETQREVERLQNELLQMQEEMNLLREEKIMDSGSGVVVGELLELKSQMMRESNEEKKRIIEAAQKEANEIIFRANLDKQQARLKSFFEIQKIKKERKELAGTMQEVLDRLSIVLNAEADQSDDEPQQIEELSQSEGIYARFRKTGTDSDAK